MLMLLLALQAGQPDIQLEARVQARRATVRREGEASLAVRAEPDGGSEVRVEGRPERRQRSYRDIDIRVRAEASVADPRAAAQAEETSRPD